MPLERKAFFRDRYLKKGKMDTATHEETNTGERKPVLVISDKSAGDSLAGVTASMNYFGEGPGRVSVRDPEVDQNSPWGAGYGLV